MTRDFPVKPPLSTRTRCMVQRLRRDMTDAERALWYRLRSARLDGLKFRRQHPVPPYVVDFHCAEAALAVELDGSQHNEGADAMRTAALQKRGMLVLRFWDNQVLTDMEAVLGEILRIARHRTLTRPFGAPSPEGRGQQAALSPEGRGKSATLSSGEKGKKRKGTQS